MLLFVYFSHFRNDDSSSNEVKENEQKRIATSKKKKNSSSTKSKQFAKTEKTFENNEEQSKIVSVAKDAKNVIKELEKDTANSILILQPVNQTENNDSDDKIKKTKKPLITIAKVKKEKVDSKKSKNHDIRKAPELIIQNVNKTDKGNHCSKENPLALTKTEKQCQNCNTRHIDNHCPLIHPYYIINDDLTKFEWQDKYSYQFEESESKEGDLDDNKCTFAKLTLPFCLYFDETIPSHGCGVFVKTEIKAFTQFGPLIGQNVKEVDIPEDFTMRDLWEINRDNNNIYINTENLNIANWIRFIRPAPTRDERNLNVIVKDDQLYFVSMRLICKGEELLYWQDSSVSASKKKLEKSCKQIYTLRIFQ